METFDAIDELARRARLESPPNIAVDVHAVLRAGRQERVRSLALGWPAVISAVAACIVVTLLLYKSPQTSSDSVVQLFGPVQVEMP